jgi:transposase
MTKTTTKVPITKTRNSEVLEALRKRAVELVESGQRQADVARSLGATPTTIWKWMDAYRTLGVDGLASRKATGRPPKLEDEQVAALRQTIIDKQPCDVGLDVQLWTLAIIRQHVERAFGVALHASSISRLLAKLGITPQRPTRSAVERDEAECRRWATEEFPKIVREVKRKQATILFEDETGLREDTPLATTWGERGRRPVVRTPGTRRRINVISAVSPHGRLWFRCYKGNLNAALFIAFLTALLRDLRGQIVLILDKHPAHVAASTKAFIAERSNRLSVHFLPGYAPDMNPDEHVWGYLKQLFRREPLGPQEDIHIAVAATMCNIQSQRDLVRTFFLHPETAYVRDALKW